MIVKKDALTIDDLYVKPVALPMQMKRLLGDYVANTDESLEDMRFGSHGGHDRGYD